MRLRRSGRTDGSAGLRGARVVPDSTAAVGADAVAEARKGTAAADPVIGVTPEGSVLYGAVVDGEFVDTGAARPTRAPRLAAHEEAEARDAAVASGEIPGENERMKRFWWVRGAAGRKRRSARQDD